MQRALRTVLADRTALIIAHRLSTVEIADRVLVLAGGRVVEDGTPERADRRGHRAGSPRCTRPGATRWSEVAPAEVPGRLAEIPVARPRSRSRAEVPVTRPRSPIARPRSPVTGHRQSITFSRAPPRLGARNRAHPGKT